MTVTFEPLSFFAVFTLNGTLPPSVLDHAPHCFTRDIDINAVQYANQANVSNLLYNQPNYEAFNLVMNGPPGGPPSPHTAGHWAGGGSNGDLAGVFSSPSDPVFFLHHGMVDLVWTVWQSLDPKNRQYDIKGGGGDTTLNIPPSPNVTLAYVENWGILDQPRTIGSLMSVTDGPFCYRYDYELPGKDYDGY